MLLNCFNTVYQVNLKWSQKAVCFLFYLLIIIQFKNQAQSCASYSVSRFTGITYTSISSSATNFASRNVATNFNDDARTNFTPIGFDFWYLGTRYSYFSASLNGYMDFSPNTTDGNSVPYGSHHNNQFSSGGANGTTLAIAPFYGDEWTATAGTAPFSSSLFYSTTGTAPNRVLTVEWMNMDEWASPANTTPASLNFQVKIYETTGIIEFVYGNMSAGSSAFAFACGINASWPTGTPTTAQLLTQQNVNTTSFSNAAKNNLGSLPSSNSKLVFTPPAPNAAPSALSFSSVANTSMVLNWTDNATNELAYVIYNSTDGVNFNFASQLSANSVSAAIIGLLPATNYTWQVFAVTEGSLSSSVSGSMATTAAGTIISVGSGNWNNTATWNCTCVPNSGDFVTIDNTHTVTLDGNGACYDLSIGQNTTASFILGNNGTSRTLSVTNNITVQSGASITVGASSATHSILLTGNINNNGNFNLAPSATRVCNISFTKNGNQSISGNGSTTNFNLITLDMGISNANILEINASNFSVLPSNFLNLIDGSIKISTPCTITPFTAATTMSSSTGIWVNHSSALLNITNPLTLTGSLRVSSGTLNIGDAADENLISHVGTIIIDGGNLNIAGRLSKLGFTSLTNLTISSGILTLPTIGSTSGGEAPFKMDERGSIFNMSGGKIVIQRPGSGNLGFLNTGGNLGTVSGGTLQIGNSSTPASQTIQVNASIPIYDLLIGDAVAVNASLNTNSLTVKNNVVINTGTLSANGINLTLGNIWNNTGNFSAGTASVIFNGTVTQQIRGASTTTFNNLNVTTSGSGAISLFSPVFISGALNLNNGKIFADASNFITMMAGSTINSGNSNSFIDGPISKTGNTAFTFHVGSGSKWARIGIGAPSASSTFKAQYFASAYTNTSSIATSPTPALHHVSTKEYWQLDRAAGTGSATVTLFWEDASNSGIFDCSTTDLRIAHWNDVSSAWENASELVNTGGSCVGAGSGSISTNAALGNFSPFTFGSKGLANNPLPITLLYFTASQYLDQVSLNWSTASEKNCDCYFVEKSIDGIHFTGIGMVKGAGNCSTKRDYHLNDMNPNPGIIYYRLKQMDFDKHFDYSNTESLEFKMAFETSVFPNPNKTNQLNIYLKNYYSESILFLIYDTYGRIILSKNISNNLSEKNYQATIQFDNKLSPGVYFLKAINDEDLFTKKLFIEAQ